MSKVAKVFGGGQKAPKVDTSAIQRQEKLLREQEERLKQQEADAAAAEEERKKKEAAAAAARKGRSSAGSLLSGLETGIEAVNAGNRTTLG